MRTAIQTGCLLLACAVPGIAQSPQGTVIYREVFGNAGRSELSYQSVGWQANLVTGADGVVADGTDIVGTFRLTTTRAGDNGQPGGLDNVGQPAATSTTRGYAARTERVESYQRAAVWTEEVSVDRSQHALKEIRFHSNNVSAEATLFGLLRLDTLNTPDNPADDVWLVSTTALKSSVASPSSPQNADFSQSTLHTISLTTETWQVLTFAPNASMDTPQGEAKTLSEWNDTGTITAFGLYIPPSSGTVRFDNYELDATPVADTEA